MHRSRLGSLGIGAVGVFATQFVMAPGQYAVSANLLELDLYYVSLGAFCFLIVWGLWAFVAGDPTGRGV